MHACRQADTHAAVASDTSQWSFPKIRSWRLQIQPNPLCHADIFNQSTTICLQPNRCMPDVCCNMSGTKCCCRTPPQSPCLHLKLSLRNRVFHLQTVWNWGNQSDVQSCLLKHPCLGFGSWTDSQPCGMAAVEGLFKLHPGWWVAVRGATDREFRTLGEEGGRGTGKDGGCGRTVTLTVRCSEKRRLKFWKKWIKWRQ